MLENEHCIVELVMVSTHDILHEDNEKFGNHSAWLHYYGSSGCHKRLNLRKMIRKKMEEVSGRFLTHAKQSHLLTRLFSVNSKALH